MSEDQSTKHELYKQVHQQLIHKGLGLNSESCRNTPNTIRKHENHAYNILFRSGSHSAHSSPLPHRRLDKLEGVIRDKSSPTCSRYHIESDGTSSVEQSPIHTIKSSFKSNECTKIESNRRNTEYSCTNRFQNDLTNQPRRRVESDCSCLKRSNPINGNSYIHNATNLNVKCRHKVKFNSPAKSSIGEPGVFSSPIHQKVDNIGSFSVLNSSAKSSFGESGVIFASPVRSICGNASPGDEQSIISDEDDIQVPQREQTIVSGWLKFRDNKRWKIRWGVVTKLSPAADCLHLQLYRDSRDRYKQGQTKASLSLQQFLGVEVGFTLDKESNTIAIICQDVIVVLAFDTRERLMQWQVKISNHLGDDIQYLVLVATAANKSKMQTGPARMHIQDHRFCLTTGVPPKLAGLWEIAYLRRYGVVDNRFCFEGGSSCGKGEGLFICVTDQGEEITATLKLASQSKLSSKKRNMARKYTNLDSLKKSHSHRFLDNDDGISCNLDDSGCTCGSRTSFWPSQESRDMEFGCGDTTSVSECHDSFNDSEIFSKPTKASLERCMSCISKLGAPSMSRSSTATGNATPNTNNPPLWTILSETNNPTNTINQKPTIDRMSICSSHGSSGGYGSSSGGSEYSVPRIPLNTYPDSTYESVNIHSNSLKKSISPISSCQCISTSTLKSNKSIPLPIMKPLQNRTLITSNLGSQIGPYENYDIPKISTQTDNISIAENYDTPKNIQEYITDDMNSNQNETINKFGNYDVPIQVKKIGNSIRHETTQNSCACNRVMSWADTLISLPYCRRGNGIENTGITINKVKLSGEGKMPIMQANGEVALYATVDFSKKTNRRGQELCNCTNDNDTISESSSSNYINLDPNHVINNNIKDLNKSKTDIPMNYTNLNFAQSLENYENSKELLQKAGITAEEVNELRAREDKNFCGKCGHENNQIKKQLIPKEYLTLDTEIENEISTKFPGYLPMSPAPLNTNVITTSNTTIPPPLPSKSDLIKRIMGEKSASNPSLSGPAVDRSRKRIEQNRIPGSAMMVLHCSGNNPYNRKQIMNNGDLLPTDKLITTRKRSSSADSSRFLEDSDKFDSSETLRKLSYNNIDGRRSSSPCLQRIICNDEICFRKMVENEDESTSSVTSTSQSQNSQSVNIRRSASVPCKTQNRDSSSSNDSGVSTGSLRHRVGDFHDFELPLTTSMSTRRHQRHIQLINTCIHATLPRRSKSFDPLREITFQFQRLELPGKSTSAEAEVPICVTKGRNNFGSPCDATSIAGPPYIDSRSTSSGTSDMSDYIETLSLSSHSSSDAPDNLRMLRQATATLRPRSGKEYQNFDRSLISLTQTNDVVKIHNTPSSLRGLLPCSTNYANITTVPENTESPSPGYQSGGSTHDSQIENFVFKNGIQTQQ